MMETIIGRKGNQPFEITDPKVSSKHLKATMLDSGKIQIEDLGSTNGTFVDGVRIIKKVISQDSVIMLGGAYRLRIGDVFKREGGVPEGEKLKSKDSLPEEFERLKAVYEDYEEAKIRIQQENARKQFLRSLPGVASTALFAFTFLLGDTVSGLKPFVGLIMLVGIGVSSLMAYKGQQSVPIKMEALNKQFMVDYVCPKCKSFLGFLPFEHLKNKGCCSMCKTKWSEV